jgi:hypothetical protein
MPLLLVRPVALAVLVLAGPCDAQRSTPTAGSSAGSQTPSDARASDHDEVVHALEKVTGTPLGASTPPAKKPGKLKTPSRRSNREDQGGGGQSEPERPKPKRGTQHIGESCDSSDECASGFCESDVCVLPYNETLAHGEKCTHNSECRSGFCTVDGTCD